MIVDVVQRDQPQNVRSVTAGWGAAMLMLWSGPLRVVAAFHQLTIGLLPTGLALTKG